MIKIYNSLTRKKEELTVNDNLVKMYSCGPTVYSFAHIGNMRAYIFMDEIRRTIKANGYDINGVMNFTDVGHMTSDEDEGEDKMMVASQKEKKSPWEIADFYGKYFLQTASKLNIDLPEHIVKATDTIKEMLDIVVGLLNKGYAYETDKGIYFDTSKFDDYGKLSGMTPDKRMAGARIEVDELKRNPTDFALWIKAPKEHIMKWESPWGLGYPGWHIECSAIGTKFLGESIDIHTGGVDHLTVHHENEIAQNNCYFGHEVVKNWMHVEFLQVDGGKMGKSLGNMYTLEQLEEKGYRALDFRYFIMQAHYSKQQNFTFQALDSSKTALNRLYALMQKHSQGTAKFNLGDLEKYKTQIIEAISDDINYPKAISILWELLKLEPSKDVYNLALELDKQIFALDLDKFENYLNDSQEIPENITEIANRRFEARKNKDWATSDKLRDELLNLGYKVLDSKDGYKLERV